MSDDKFLQQVAEYYCSSDLDLSGLTLVFPNKRAAMFMRKYMRERLRGVSFMPKFYSISYFIQQFCGSSTLASETEQLFTLYDCYRRVLKRRGREEDTLDFDSFVFWGIILINDFSDVDAYMADPAMLFKNLRDEREIRANYLTEAQLEVVRELWGDAFANYDVEKFWTHMPSGENESEEEDDESDGDEKKQPKKPSKRFLALWEILDDLYEEFTINLASRPIPLATSGAQSRLACKTILGMGRSDFPRAARYAFVGFNVLSTSRIKIFKHLQKLGMADFFWDTAFADRLQRLGERFIRHNRATQFILSLRRRFPMPEDFDLLPLETTPDIEVISCPSNIGQVKACSRILGNWLEEGVLRPADEGKGIADNMLSTAVVLPDESLLIPSLYSLQQSIAPINVTMGLSYRFTPFASLMSMVFAMHLRHGVRPGCFFYVDVEEVLAHPHVARIAPEEVEAMRGLIRRQRLYNVPASELQQTCPHLTFLFAELPDDATISSATAFVMGLVDGLDRGLKEMVAGKSIVDSFEEKVLEGYRNVVEELCRYIEKYSVAMSPVTFFRTLERSLGHLKLNFSGKPLIGLQVMGVMDTRALDFENLVILSMNERIFPRRSFKPSFIPEILRRGYGLPTHEHEESTYAYQFYRMISRASRVRLIYDSRTRATVSGEMSRYLYQLLYLPAFPDVRRRSVVLPATVPDNRGIVVHKTPKVIEELRRFRVGAERPRNLSASALKTYMDCPMLFYLKFVKGLRDEEVNTAYISPALFGSVLHRVMQELYNDFKGQVFTPVVFSTLLAKDKENLILSILDEVCYGGSYKGQPARMPGEARVLAKLIDHYAKIMLNTEKTKNEGFTFLSAEEGEGVVRQWKVTDDYEINFKMSIDRKDRLADGTLRFIDYKTGADEYKADSIDVLFSNHSKSGIFQLFAYCEAYADLEKYDGPIQPMLYQIQTMAVDGLPPISIKRKPATDYRQYHEEFREQFNHLIHCILEENDEFPFEQTDDTETCKYCPFVDMCRRREPPKF